MSHLEDNILILQNIIKKQRASIFLFLFYILFLCYWSCKDSPNSPPEEINRQITILYTNYEHGWMKATSTTGGAAGLMGLWRQQEGYKEDEPYLILSGGDMWIGPVISTWFV